VGRAACGARRTALVHALSRLGDRSRRRVPLDGPAEQLELHVRGLPLDGRSQRLRSRVGLVPHDARRDQCRLRGVSRPGLAPRAVGRDATTRQASRVA
jgi:hypothetical protein